VKSHGTKNEYEKTNRLGCRTGEAKWAMLTDDDLQFAEGEHDELLDRIQERTGETREAIEQAVKEAYLP
jgi:uncharacterized protein YjbJ (UPF0337 family)